ncbi:MAG: hypothetical protein IPG96_15350 [Proteobacteria bacterium]|nr:hypothetical protein [Pseudomonadota bacterium]
MGPPLVGLRPGPSKPAASDAWRGEDAAGKEVDLEAVDWRPFVPAAHRAFRRITRRERGGEPLAPPLDVVGFFLESAQRVLADERRAL